MTQFNFQQKLLREGWPRPEDLESGKRSVVFELINREKSVFDLLSQSAIMMLQNLEENYNR
jgi:hypothetical protein